MAQCLLLRHVRTDAAHLLVVGSMHQPLAVGTCNGRFAQGEVQRVGGQQGVVLKPEVHMHARPAMRFGHLHHRRSHRIELDVAHYAEQVCVRIDQAGFVAPLPQRAGAAMAMIESLDVGLAHQNGVRFTYSGVVGGIGGRCAGRTPTKTGSGSLIPAWWVASAVGALDARRKTLLDELVGEQGNATPVDVHEPLLVAEAGVPYCAVPEGDGIDAWLDLMAVVEALCPVRVVPQPVILRDCRL